MDRRDRMAATKRWYESIDFGRSVATMSDPSGETDDTREIPVKFEVCPTCHGRGTHVNPSIDAHGISPEEFAEDPDFAESYFSGAYDVDCAECNGARVIPVPIDPDVLADIERREQDEADYLAEVEAERRMGC